MVFLPDHADFVSYLELIAKVILIYWIKNFHYSKIIIFQFSNDVWVLIKHFN
jgi:hypothetical protein